MNISSSTLSSVELSGKTVDYIVKNAMEETNTEAGLRKAVALTLEQITFASNSKKSAEALVAGSFREQRELVSRISFARAVGQNTLRKMTHGHPATLNWMNSRGRITVIGVFRRVSSFRDQNSYNDITDRIISGTESIKASDVVRFSVTAFNGKVLLGEIAVELLRNDPIAVAQLVRRECRIHAEKEYNARNNDIAKRISDLEKDFERNLAKLKGESTEKNYAKPIKPEFRNAPKRPRKPVIL